MNVAIDYEGLLERFYRGLLRPSDTCVDVGAHEGRHTFPMHQCVGGQGRILAFEPLPDFAERLRTAVAERNAGTVISVIQQALFDKMGRTTFMVAVDAPAYSGILKRVYDIPTDLREIEVALTTLDEAAVDLPSLHYIKIDAEGAEWNILKGAARTLHRFRPVVSFEFGEASYHAYDVVPERVHGFFAELGYRVYDIRGRQLDQEGFATSALRQEVWDYIAIPEAHDHDAVMEPLRHPA